MRRLAITVAVTALGSTAFASAASLGVGSDSLGAGNATVAACDPNGFTVSYTTTSAGNVTHATVGDIADPGCEGGRLELRLTGSGTVLGTGGPTTVPTDADTDPQSVTLTIPEQPAGDQVDTVHVVVGGP